MTVELNLQITEIFVAEAVINDTSKNERLNDIPGEFTFASVYCISRCYFQTNGKLKAIGMLQLSIRQRSVYP